MTQDVDLPRATVWVRPPHGDAVFLGYGTAVGPRIVVVHPTAALAARAVLSGTGKTELPVRCRVDVPGRPVIDGTLLPAADQPGWGSLLAVSLDRVLVAALDVGPVFGAPPDTGGPPDDDSLAWLFLSPDEYARGLGAALRAWEETDPPVPPAEDPPTRTHGGMEPPPREVGISSVGSRPFWCLLFPRAAGCT